MQPKLFNKLNYKANGEGYARLFDYEVKAPNAKEAEEKLSSSDRMEFLQASQPKGYVYTALQEQLEKTTDKAVRHKIAVNMERCRWQMKHPAENERMVLVNIPAQQLWAIGEDSVLEMRVCCGATTTKTPLLSSAISYMQVNPDWIIPSNIVKTDVSRHGGDSAYFARHRYYIIDRSSGDTLRPADVSASDLTSGRLRIGQKGGAGNSLGRIVFRFPNNFSVYLHDTNNRGAFSRECRTLSHGCVRVQKPFELACFLLPDADDWTKDRLRISMDMTPETEQGRIYLQEHSDAPRPYRLETYREVTPRVPIYIIYYTAYPNPMTGVVETWPDLYDYDKVISQEMGSLLL
jgi:murein L,D-transpeptidase YcbB/YkuD